MSLELVPISFAEAKAFVKKHHRHHQSPVGCKFCVAVAKNDEVVGVAIAGRPVARGLDDSWTVEVTRVCTDGTRNACSMLYGAIWRAARALGYRKAVTYILEDEKGVSVKAAGWKCVGKTAGGSWSCRGRPRVDKHPLQRKFRFERAV